MNRLKMLRIEKDYTEIEIETFLHISKEIYLEYENEKRKIPLKVLIFLSRFYNTSIDYIINDTNFKKPHEKKYKI